MTPDPQEQAPDLDEIQEYCNAATEAEQWPQLIISYALVDLPALVKYTRSLQARLAEAERDKWLPIDTAPRDTNLIGAMLVDGRPVRACMIYWGDIGWYEPYSGKSAHYVTHWLQIPGH